MMINLICLIISALLLTTSLVVFAAMWAISRPPRCKICGGSIIHDRRWQCEHCGEPWKDQIE
jgi:hypothetical protein